MNPFPLLCRCRWCACIVVFIAGAVCSADPPKTPADKLGLDLIPDPDIEWLKRSKVPTDNAGLIAFLRSCQGKEIEPAEIDAAVAKLMTGTKAEQDEAPRKLAEFGTIAVPSLRKHRTDNNADAAKRVRDCLEKIEEAGDKPLARPAIRRLSLRKAPGTAEALFGYLPFASDPAAEEDIYYELDSLIEREPKTLAVLPAYLKDAQPSRRALAACILGRRGNPEQRLAVRDLLKDPDSLVRLRAAQGLLAGHGACGVPTLIDLVADPSIEIAWQAEELLRWLSNETAPDAVIGGGAATPEAEASARTKCQNAWRQWVNANAAKIDFAELEKEPRRPLLLLGYDRAKGRVWLFGSDGVTRCEWETKRVLADAQYVPGGTVLTLHEQPVREKPLLAERDRAGKVLWQYEDMVDPQYCQRLSSGNVFVAEYQNVAEPYMTYRILSTSGRLLRTQPRKAAVPGWSSAIREADDGKIVCAWLHQYTRSHHFASLEEYDPTADSSRKLQITGGDIGKKIYVEPAQGGGYLVSGFANLPNRKDRMVQIVEYDNYGDSDWKYMVPDGTHAFRLRSGNTVACTDDRVVEISPDRRMVGEIRMLASPTVARPCLSLVRFGFDTFPTNIDLETDVDYRVRCLGKKDPRARLFALQRLADFEKWAAIAIPKLKMHGDDPDPPVREALRKTLVAIGAERIPQLLTEAKHSDPERRYAALNQVRSYQNGPGVLDALLDGLKDENAKVRRIAVLGLGHWDRDSQSRRLGYVSSGAYRWAADKVVPALVKAVTDSDEKVRLGALRDLGLMGPKGKAGVPALIGWLKNDPDTKVRFLAAVALGKIGQDSPEARSALLTVAKETKDVATRKGVLEGLCYLRPLPSSINQLIIEAYQSTDEKTQIGGAPVRESLLYKLREIGANDKASLDFLTGIMKDGAKPLNQRLRAAEHLVEFGPDGIAVVRYLAAIVPDMSSRQVIEESIRLCKKVLSRRSRDDR